ncbi:hypothetical protein [Pseudotabrizicola sp. L79]|uniref:hypothetical protein n=1 Tax=Pseudotabrizicola sp. L79 TaxID=3118402 RepID=UPI002F92C1B5
MRPDLLIVGDSHCGALQEAAVASGLNSKMLFLSGNLWHENRMRPHPTQGLSVPHRPALNRRIAAFAAEAQSSVFPKDIPVLASIGYHLGRLVPPFARHGHSPDPTHAATEDAALFTSDAFLTGYIFHHRSSLFRLLRLASQDARLLVIAPPMIQTDPVALHVAARITRILRDNGIAVFDPREEPDWADAPLPEHLRAPDGVHGNPAYGAEVLSRLFDRNLIRMAAAAE